MINGEGCVVAAAGWRPPSGRRRPRWSTSSTPRSASAGGRARSCRRASRCRPAAPRRSTRSVRSSAPKPTSTWLSTTSLATSAPPAVERVGEPAGQAAAPLDQLGDAVPAQLAQRRPDRETPGPAGGLEREVRGAGRDPVEPTRYAAVYDTAATCTSGSRAEDEPAVVGDVEPLVPVAAPRVGQLDAVDQVPRCSGWRRPTARTRRRRAPSAPCRRARSQAARRSSQAPVFTLPACRQTIVGPAGPAASTRARSPTSIAPLASAATGSTDAGAEAEQPQRPVDGGVPLAAGDHPDPRARRPGRPRSTSQPASASTWCRPAARPTVFAACAPVHEADRRGRRDAEQLLEPAAGDLLGHHGGR